MHIMAVPCMPPRTTAGGMHYADLPGFLRAASAPFIAASNSPAFTASMTVRMVGTSLVLHPPGLGPKSSPQRHRNQRAPVAHLTCGLRRTGTT